MPFHMYIYEPHYRQRHTHKVYVQFTRSAIYFPCLLYDVYFCVFNTSLFCYIRKTKDNTSFVRISGSKHTLFFFILQTNLCVLCLFPSKYTWNTNEITKTNSSSPNPMNQSNSSSSNNDKDDYDNEGNISLALMAHKQYALMFSHFTE